jgi:serine/threonine protein kinase
LEECKNDAIAIRLIRHKCIVEIYDVISADELCFVVREHIAGLRLGDVLSRQGKLDRSKLPALFAEMAEGLQHAHARGIVHGELTPWEIILDADFHPHICFPGFFEMGTPTYAQLAPERYGRASNVIDWRIDILSLGFLMFESLTGHRPFDFEDLRELLPGTLKPEPASPRQFDPSIPVELERICLKCLARQLNERYTTAADLAEELWRFHGGRPPTSPLPTGPTSIRKVLNASPSTQVPRGRRWFWPFRGIVSLLRDFPAHRND